MASYNRVILVGNLTRDIELRYTPSQTAVTDIGLAVNDRRKTATGEWVEEPVFVDVTLWGRTAEIASQYLGKGSSVLIEGRLKFDTWETDGQKRSKLRVVGERMQMLGARGPGQPHPAEGASGEGASGDFARVDSQTSAPSSAQVESAQVESAQVESAPVESAPAPGGVPPDDEIPF